MQSDAEADAAQQQSPKKTVPNQENQICPNGIDCGGYWNGNCKKKHYRFVDGDWKDAEKERHRKRVPTPPPSKE